MADKSAEAIPDHYQALRVARNAELDTIKRQYQQLLLLYHPDKVTARGDGDVAAASAQFKRVQEAWEVLKDANARGIYDHQLKNGMLARPHPVNGEVDLDDMDYDAETAEYSYPCRCGGAYLVAADELEQGTDTVQCAQCSLSVLVLYTLNDDGA